MTDRPLTDRQRRFVEEYLIHGMPSRAYAAAYPDASRMSCWTAGPRLLRHAGVRAAIAAERRDQAIRLRVTADNVIRELACIAFADPIDVYTDDGRVRHPGRIPIETRRAIASIKVRRTRSRGAVREEIIDVRLCDKIAALDQLFELLGLTTSIPPIDVLLNSLPRRIAGQLRDAMAAPPTPTPRAGDRGTVPPVPGPKPPRRRRPRGG